MKSVDIVGYKRDNTGKRDAKRLRNEGNVPCVIYGGKEEVHFYAPMILFRPLVYTPDAHTVNLNIEGDEYKCILQDAQYHPVSEVMLHADFLLLHDDKPVKMDIPVKLKGNAPGVIQGGKLLTKLRYIRVKAVPEHLPDMIEVDVSKLDLGKSIKVKELSQENYEILNNPLVSIATVEIPRALRGKGGEGAEEGVEEEEATA